MKIKRALIQAGTVAIIFVIFLIIFALCLLYANGLQRFSNFYFPILVGLGLPTLIVLSLVSFANGLLEKR